MDYDIPYFNNHVTVFKIFWSTLLHYDLNKLNLMTIKTFILKLNISLGINFLILPWITLHCGKHNLLNSHPSTPKQQTNKLATHWFSQHCQNGKWLSQSSLMKWWHFFVAPSAQVLTRLWQNRVMLGSFFIWISKFEAIAKKQNEQYNTSLSCDSNMTTWKMFLNATFFVNLTTNPVCCITKMTLCHHFQLIRIVTYDSIIPLK